MAFSRQIRSFILNLVRRQAANAAVEYAVCLGLVVGAVLVAGFLIGAPLQSAFSTAAAGMQSPSGGPAGGIDNHTANATTPAIARWGCLGSHPWLLASDCPRGCRAVIRSFVACPPPRLANGAQRGR